MRHIRINRVGLAFLLAATGLATASGCTHNYYYTGVPGACGPATVVPGSVAYGEVCEIPSSVSGGTSVVTRTPSIVNSPTLGGARPPRVVTSEPLNRPRYGWRVADPDGFPTTIVEGGREDSSVTR